MKNTQDELLELERAINILMHEFSKNTGLKIHTIDINSVSWGNKIVGINGYQSVKITVKA